MTDDDHSKDAFLEAKEAGGGNLITELIGFMKENKKWWLAPILVVLLLLAALAIFAGTGVAPFIYTLF